MNRKIAVHVVANIVLIVLVASVFAVGFYGNAYSAFKPEEYRPIYKGNRGVSLMINVYWGTEYIDGMLETLDEYNVKATFFIGGCWAVKNPETLEKICAAGHEIANHGYNHKSHSKLNYDENQAEIDACCKVVFQLCGAKTTLFMPPSGDFGDNTLKAAFDIGHKTVMWSRDTVDWRDKDANVVFTRATEKVSEGELILMHPTAHTAKALPKILEFYKQNGFNVVTVSENLES